MIRPTPFRNQSAGFSLIELLVVIAVLVVLVALSLPVINQVITKSETIKCMGHFRQLGAALGSYAGDHQGEWPWPIDERDVDFPGTWISRPLKHESGRWTGIGKLFPYIRDKRVYVCPADKKKTTQVHQLGDYSSEENLFPTSYVTRGFNQSYNPKRPNFQKLATLGRRSIAACNFAYAPANPVNFPLSWHKGTYPVLFSDGSVEQIRLPLTEAQQKDPPDINGSTSRQMRIWDYFDGATTTLTL